MLGITIRMSGERDTVTINGATFDRSSLDRHQRRTMASMVQEVAVQKLPSKQPKGRRNGRKQARS